MLRIVVPIVLAAALVAAAPAGAAEWRLGVVVDGPLTDGNPRVPDPAAEWDRLAASGATTVRASFYWSVAQPDGPGRVTLGQYDAVVLAAARRGLDVVPVVVGTPAWAALVPGEFGSPPRQSEAYGAFLEALAARYGPRGSLWREYPGVRRRPIRAWQIWNEPDLDLFWSRQPFQHDYARLVATARRALRRADPGAKVVLAGLPNRSWESLDLIYAAGGRGSFDAVAIHPFTARPRDVIRILALVRGVMAWHGDGAKPLWVTELSWTAAEGKSEVQIGIETSQRGQARRLSAGLRLLAAARRRLKIRRVYWYTWISHEGRLHQGRTDTFGWSGLRRLRSDGRVVSAPALRVFRRAARRLRQG
jgi:hypothetical protein